MGHIHSGCITQLVHIVGKHSWLLASFMVCSGITGVFSFFKAYVIQRDPCVPLDRIVPAWIEGLCLHNTIRALLAWVYRSTA